MFNVPAWELARPSMEAPEAGMLANMLAVLLSPFSMKSCSSLDWRDTTASAALLHQTRSSNDRVRHTSGKPGGQYELARA